MKCIYGYLYLSVNSALLVVEFIVVVGVHLQVVECKLLLDSFFECLSLFQGQGVGLGNDRDDVDNVRELLKDNNINGFQTGERVSNACRSNG